MRKVGDLTVESRVKSSLLLACRREGFETVHRTLLLAESSLVEGKLRRCWKSWSEVTEEVESLRIVH